MCITNRNSLYIRKHIQSHYRKLINYEQRGKFYGLNLYAMCEILLNCTILLTYIILLRISALNYFWFHISNNLLFKQVYHNFTENGNFSHSERQDSLNFKLGDQHTECHFLSRDENFHSIQQMGYYF